jgi:hypothetical protein
VNTKETLSLTGDERQRLRVLLADQIPQNEVPPVLERQQLPATANQGFVLIDGARTHLQATAGHPSAASSSESTPDTPSISQPAPLASTASLNVPSTGSSATSPHLLRQGNPAVAAEAQLAMELWSRKRVSDTYLAREPAKKPRRGQTCMKCGSQQCPGRKAATLCKGICGCGKPYCRGLNSRRPGVPCTEAWS